MKTRRATTLIEVVVVTTIILIVCLLVTMAVIAAKKNAATFLYQGEEATVVATGMRVLVVGYGRGDVLICRIDHGPGSVPRFQELHFMRDELRKLPEIEK